MNNTLLLIGAFCICLIISFCTISCSKKSTEPMVDTSISVQEKITTLMGRKVQTSHNTSGDHILCIKKEGSLLSSFMVLSKDGNIIIAKKKVRGSVAWHNDDAVAVTIIPGVVDKRSSTSPEITIIPIRKTKEAI